MIVQATLDRYTDREVNRYVDRVEEKLRKFLRRKEIPGELCKTTTTDGKIVIDFEKFIEFDMELAYRLIDNPKYFLSNADHILEKITGVLGAHLCVRRLDKSVRIRGLRAEHVGKFVQVDSYVVDIGADCFYIQNIDWVANIISLDAPLRVDPGWGSSYPLECRFAADAKSFVSDSCVRLGNYVVVTGILLVEPGGPEPVFRGVLTLGSTGYIFNKFLEVSHVGVPEFVPWETWYKATHYSSEKRQRRCILDSMRRLGLKCIGEGGRIDD